MCEPLNVPICVSTSVGESLVGMYSGIRGCIVVFSDRETQADLILLDMVDFNVILGMNWLSSCHAIRYLSISGYASVDLDRYPFLY